MVHKHGTDGLTLEDINQQINNIFASEGVQPDGPGEEAFWNAVENIACTNEQAANDLTRLGNTWAEIAAQRAVGLH
jgi:hypothetical protein